MRKNRRDLQLTAKRQDREWFNLVGLVLKGLGNYKEEEKDNQLSRNINEKQGLLIQGILGGKTAST